MITSSWTPPCLKTKFSLEEVEFLNLAKEILMVLLFPLSKFEFSPGVSEFWSDRQTVIFT